MIFVPGLVSISFRSLSFKDIVKISELSSLKAIEWGSDVHVPAGNAAIAENVRDMTLASGIEMPEYGSYYTLGKGENVKSVVESARILGTNTVRIWAGESEKSKTSAKKYRDIVSEAKYICKEYCDINFCLECHNYSLTQEYHDELAFLSDVGCTNFNTFWQPNQLRSHEYNIESLKALLPYTYSVHVFAWEGEKAFPLIDHEKRWMDYIEILSNSPREKMYLMLEFMHDNRPESLKETAKTLRSWI